MTNEEFRKDYQSAITFLDEFSEELEECYKRTLGNYNATDDLALKKVYMGDCQLLTERKDCVEALEEVLHLVSCSVLYGLPPEQVVKKLTTITQNLITDSEKSV